MTKARIYKPSKTAMQSGRGKTAAWVLEYEPATPKGPESLMGWTAAGDTLGQIRLKFTDLKEAQQYAEAKGLEYTISGEHERRLRPRNYGDNFRYIPVEEDGKR